MPLSLRTFATVCILCVLLSATACTDDDPAPQPVQRVVIAYLCGDNSLSAEIELKIAALEEGMAAAENADGRLIAYADSRDGLPRLMEITAKGTVVIETSEEDTDSASPENMRRILQRIVTDFPARGYGLICFSHASGWLPQGALDDPAGFSRSHAPTCTEDQAGRASSAPTRTIFEDGGGEMSLADLAWALDVIPGSGKFDFILFETCYMAGVEAVYELRERTRYVVASSAEILSDGFTQIYPQHVGSLFAPEPDLESFARSYFDLWNAKQGAWRSATISLINTAHIDDLAELIGSVGEGGPDWAAGIDISAVQHFNRNRHHLFFDLGQAAEMAADPEQSEALAALLAKTVVYKASTPTFMYGNDYAFAISRHSGLTTYIPQHAFPLLNASYTQTGWHGRLAAE